MFFSLISCFLLLGEIHCCKLFLAAPLSSMKNSCEWCSIDLKWRRSVCLDWMTSCNYMLMLKFILNCCILIPPFNLKISCNKADNKMQTKYHMCSQGELAMSCWNVFHFMSSCSNSASGNQTVIIRSKYRIKDGRGLIPSTFIPVCLSLCVIKIYGTIGNCWF